MRLAGTALVLALGLAAEPALADTIYTQTNLVSDLTGVAPVTDPNLQNPWGIAYGPTSPFWVNDNGTNKSTLYNGAGHIVPLVVNVPGNPTGIAFNGTSGFGKAPFIFAGEGGAISTWNGGTSAVLAKDMSPSGAVYKGLAIANVGSASRLYATNFHAGAVDMFSSNFSYLGSFTDTTVGDGFAPFNVQNIGGNLFVTFAKQNAEKHDDVAGPGNGFVDEFNPDGTLIRRFASNGTLNSPWGVALAPAGFGQFSGDLLIGNFGDGRINAFNPASGSFLGQLHDAHGPLTIDGLWGLKFGNGTLAGATNTLFFTAGIPGPGGHIEDHGLFGNIASVPEPASVVLLLAGLAGVVVLRTRIRDSV